MADPYDLHRFVDAQAPVFEQVLRELSAGRKTSHWMWFVFPQIEGLGSSEMAKRYAIRSKGEAQAYLDHELLGPRLQNCTALVNRIEGRSIQMIFGEPDDMKFHSSMTLFSQVSSTAEVFEAALEKFFQGRVYQATMTRLEY